MREKNAEPDAQRVAPFRRNLALGRIAVIGCGGAGKTFLSNQLAELTNAPLTHLDSIYYDSKWNPLPAQDFTDEQEKLLRTDRWIIEGNYANTLPIRLARADTVIFLDIHPLVCLAGIIQRRLRYRGVQHERDGVYDHITPQFVRYVIGYRKFMRPRIQNLVHDHGTNAQLVTLTSRRAASRFLRNVRSMPDLGE
ncbi:MAG: topology modulation protein [Frondihabitans sp.]|nr:topology modulation protein [Frondihabitans sp.]